ncbi:hypothetical protein NIES4071_88860 [Calothrix sp. NIES-4071]|nr:hypothetical protein NIES4071_88860 [Calothrix sp. NIES-4071]BAZ63153.1 hypothetical protein NIES4105_88790 [Calothrix sp. NIES-4105]
MLTKILILTSFVSPVWVITPSNAIQNQPIYTIAQGTSNEAEIREACKTRQLDKLPSPYTDVPRNHWAYSAVASLYYCKSRGIFATAPTSQLQTAPTKVTIDGRTYTLNAYVWRDFMPSVGTSNKGLMANVNLVPDDGNPVLASLRVDKLWVINGTEIWETNTPNTRSGPQWQPGAKVDVVVQIKGANGQTYLLRNLSQQIQATY